MTQNFAQGLPLVTGEAITAYKSADESVASSIALQDDNELVFAMEANGIYSFTFSLFCAWNSGGGIRLAVNGPAGVVNVIAGGLSARVSGAGDVDGIPVVTAYETAAWPDNEETETGIWVKFEGSVENGANAGNLVLRWAQHNSNANNTTILRGSWLLAHKVG